MRTHLATLFLGSVLLTATLSPAQDRRDAHDQGTATSQRYEDRSGHDSHEWNQQEDQFYRRYLSEHHRKYRDFSKSSRREQEQYWKWRHQHTEQDRQGNRDHDRH